MRIAIGGIIHETNTYCQGYTRAGDFTQLRGQRLLRTAGQETDVGGAVNACNELDIEAVPLLYALAQPSGIIDRTSYDGFVAELLDQLASQAPIDGVVLTLHGAGVVDGIADLEADLVAQVRTALGRAIPIAATFDLHGNITAAMTDNLQGAFACEQYPHIDLHVQGERAVQFIARLVQTGQTAHCEIATLPMLIPTTTTFEGIGQSMLADLQALAAAQSANSTLLLSWFHGFPYCDVAHVGASIVVTGLGEDTTRAKSLACAAAAALWNRREGFRPLSLSADEAVVAAQSHSDYPVVINETSDNCGGGTPGDGTHLLRAMLDARLGSEACFGFIVDAQVALQAHAAGVGARIEVELGGKTDDLHGKPLKASAEVRALHDGRLVMQHMFRGAPLNVGKLARLVIEDMDIVVGSKRSQTFDREPFLAVGIQVERYRYVALKSSNHFRAGFTELAGAIVTADPPGLCTHQIGIFPRETTARRLWPLHEDAQIQSDSTA